MSVDCTVSDAGNRLIATLTGAFGLGEVADLRVQLHKCLAEQPEALLIDLSGLTLTDPLALVVFVAVRRQAARWPGIPMLLCAPDPAARAALSSAAYRSVPVFATLAEGHAAVGRGREALPTLSDELLPVSGAARQARNVATEACVRWDLSGLIAPASLIASELVSNVVDHVHTMMTLHLALRPRYLHIAVRDGSAVEPVRADGVDESVRRGRGLLLVDATAHSWGWLPTDNGKVVWASLPRPAG